MRNLILEIYVIENLGKMSTDGVYYHIECGRKVLEFETDFEKAMNFISSQDNIIEFEDMEYGKKYTEYALSVELVDAETGNLVSTATYDYYKLTEVKEWKT